jgi:hypothetical protein
MWLPPGGGAASEREPGNAAGNAAGYAAGSAARNASPAPSYLNPFKFTLIRTQQYSIFLCNAPLFSFCYLDLLLKIAERVLSD